MMLFIRVVALWMFALVVSQAAQAQEPGAPYLGTTRLFGPYTEWTTQLHFPQLLGPLGFAEVIDHEKLARGLRPGLGVSIRYEGPRGIRAEIAILNLGKSGIPDGIYEAPGKISELIAWALSAQLDAIRQGERMGWWRNVTTREPRVFGPRDNPRAHFLGTLAHYRTVRPVEEEMSSFVALFGHRNQFIRVRYTENRETYERSDGKLFGEFMEALLALTAGQSK